MNLYNYIKDFLRDIDDNDIRVNFHTTSDDGTKPENVFVENSFELNVSWNKYVVKYDYAQKNDIYIISFYQKQDNHKKFVLNGIFYVDQIGRFWQLQDEEIFRQYGYLTVEYENRKNNYPTLKTVKDKGCEIIKFKE